MLGGGLASASVGEMGVLQVLDLGEELACEVDEALLIGVDRLGLSVG